MKILDGYCDWAWEKELKVLMTNMANLSKYQPILFDAISMGAQERNAFNKAQEDYSLFESGMLYIFSEPVYTERIIAVFNDLTYKNRSNFYAYYESFSETAANHGFLTEYNQILQELNDSGWGKYVRFILFGSLLYYFTDSLFISLVLYLISNNLLGINRKLDNSGTSFKQTDLIVKKLNSELIERNLDYAKKKLIKFGFLNKDRDPVLSE